jgi:pimeloyl-ACP methyl ester carboxylesterase
MLQASHPHVAVASEIYPTYDTRGSLARASDALLEWLTTRTVELECKPAVDAAGVEVPAARSGRGLGAGSVRLILCGHSMGGLIAVDAAVSSASSAPPGPHRHDQLWPRICGVVAFDTPYYGVHPKTFANAASKYGSYLKTAHSIGSQLAPLGASLGFWGASQAAAASSSARKVKDTPPQEQKKAASGWSTALLAGSAVALAAGGATAGMWYGGGYDYLKEHMLYVGNLWDEEGQKARCVEKPVCFRLLSG